MATEKHWTDFYDHGADLQKHLERRRNEVDPTAHRPDDCVRQYDDRGDIKGRPQQDGDKWCHRCWRAIHPDGTCPDGIFEPPMFVRREDRNGKTYWRFERG